MDADVGRGSVISAPALVALATAVAAAVSGLIKRRVIYLFPNRLSKRWHRDSTPSVS